MSGRAGPAVGEAAEAGSAARSAALGTLALAVFAIVAFAGNSMLTRAALADRLIGAEAFAAIRLVSGAVVLALIAGARGGRVLPRRRDAAGVLALFVYAAAFSFAYLDLATATGALILFASVQFTMTGTAAARGAPPRGLEALGLAVALGGFGWLLAPGVAAPPVLAAVLMTVAGVAWGAYTLLGRGATDPLAHTARNFVGAAPLSVGLLALAPPAGATAEGVILAVVSGAVTSGLGYAVWYAVLPRLTVTVAGAAQLLVPAVAAAGGTLWLGEALSLRIVGATLLIMAGVGIALRGRR